MLMTINYERVWEMPGSYPRFARVDLQHTRLTFTDPKFQFRESREIVKRSPGWKLTCSDSSTTLTRMPPPPPLPRAPMDGPRANGAPPAPPSVSAEIGPPLFPGLGRTRDAGGGLLRNLFARAPPNSHSTMVANHSFGELPFVGGEDDAQDAWRDKWEAHARRSFDEARRRSSVDDGGKTGVGGR